MTKFQNDSYFGVKIKENEFWETVSHTFAFEWETNHETLISWFISHQTSNLKDLKYKFSHDIIFNNSIELYGLNDIVYWRDNSIRLAII